MKYWRIVLCAGFFAILAWPYPAAPQSGGLEGNVYPMVKLKPRDSLPMLGVGDRAPHFSLPSVHRGEVSLSQYRGKKNVVLSFLPAAWTQVCSEQWPGYNIAKAVFDEHDAILLGITVDNIPTLYCWTDKMVGDKGELWFPVLSDFWPHGEVAKKYGVLRSDGVSERALFIIDKRGIIRYIDVYDINKRPPLEELVSALRRNCDFESVEVGPR